MKYLLQEMTTIEAKEAFERTDLAIIPVGSTEVHGPHNPVFTDSNAAMELSNRIGEKMNGMAIVAPLIPFGYSPYHMNFHGTITFTQQTLTTVLLEVADSLIRFGIRRIFITNGHGGNRGAINEASSILYDNGVLCAIPFWYEAAKKLNERWKHYPDHGGFKETMVNMVAMPDAVRMDLYEPAKIGTMLTDNLKVIYARLTEFEGVEVPVCLPTEAAWPLGFAEDDIPANEATREVAQFYTRFLAEFRKVPLPPETI